jgi:two-component system response regulator AtoC
LSSIEQEIKDYWAFIAAPENRAGIQSQIEWVARKDFPVLVSSECGLAREAAARLIHRLSSRGARRFMKIDCRALPAETLHSELFGSEAAEGSSGRTATNTGKFELCDKGSIFLDGIERLPARVQEKLLRLLHGNYISPLHGESIVNPDVRILAGIPGNIEQTLRVRGFREELYYCLNFCSIRIPPLRERPEDIPFLFHHFLKKYNDKFQMAAPDPSKELLTAARQYPWPGNLEEFENFVKRYIVAKSSRNSRSEQFEFFELLQGRKG